ncbi:Transmembrane protein 62 [Frankliniella fusca]|uniref:Transmembrane protein 62 n=1 Tax=Frankliniella fusca TaxID=407009 RepID=A0AAE1GTW4_9NEOP|nr:Transmembrane protein 62 [Frankliniella fusca]
MALRKNTLLLLILISSCSIFIASISDIISVNIEATEANANEKQNAPDVPSFVMSNSPDNLMWFLQVSDTHISIFRDPTRLSDLHSFCRLTIPAIRPSVILASGDLTDAKAADNMGSAQYEQEWIRYRNLIDKCNLGDHTPWLDIRGNHDSFNIPDANSTLNYYYKYSEQGKKYPRSYLYQLSKGKTKYSFLAVDASLAPGPRRPFNFVGLLNTQESNHIKNLMKQIEVSGSNYTVWFGHYPTSCILSSGSEDIRSLIGKQPQSLVYLCGHFHTFGGAVPNMYTLQKKGFLELELGDWMDNRLFRLLAIDHGLLSFIDLKHGEWPAILVTNPKHALYHITGREPQNLIVSSTHVRILVFSLDKIQLVQVQFNDGQWLNATHEKDALYTVAWTPKSFASGIHYMHVKAVDVTGRHRIITHPFSIDGTRLSFNFLPRFVLMSSISTVFQVLFGTILFLCVVPLCITKYMHHQVRAKKMERPRFRVPYFNLWLRRIWVLASVDRIFYPLTIYAVYLTFGPWSIGAIIEGHIGVIFAWGIIVNGAYLPGSFTFAYGFLQLLLVQLPLTILLSCYLHRKLLLKMKGKTERFRDTWWNQTVFAALLTFQTMLAYMFWLAYGTMAFILGPLRTWSTILSVFLWYQATFLPDHCLKEAKEIWDPKRKTALQPEEIPIGVNPAGS